MRRYRVGRTLAEGTRLGALVLAVTTWFPEDGWSSTPLWMKVVTCLVGLGLAYLAGVFHTRWDRRIKAHEAEAWKRRWAELGAR